jgi:HlyD family secretion protein
MTASHAKGKWLLGAAALLAVAGVAIWLAFGGAAQWRLPASVQALLQRERLPDYLVRTNGRIEATEVDVATKLAGRLTEVRAREGDLVEAREIVARLDMAALQAQLRQAQAELQRAERDRDYSEAIVSQRESELEHARRELDRLRELEKRSFVAVDQVDLARTNAHTADAALRAARFKVAETEAAIAAAAAQIDRIAVDIEDCVLKAPRRGRVLYRLAEPGEVLGAGGKLLTLLDLSDVYMVLFLPETVVGRVAVGSEARIVLDAAPEYVIPAEVSFVAARAQFTPKQVETRSEREKLVFRVKATIDPALLDRYEPLVKTGVPGVAYVKLNRESPWPDWLQVKLPPWPQQQARSPD